MLLEDIKTSPSNVLTGESFVKALNSSGENTCSKARKMLIADKNTGQPIAKILVNTQQGYPLLSIPTDPFHNLKIMDTPFTTQANLTKYSNLVFKEFFTDNEHEMEVTQEVFDFALNERSKGNNKQYPGRYIVLGECINPMSGVVYTFFLDVLLKDIFIVCGLNYIINPGVKIQNRDDAYIHIVGYTILSVTTPRFSRRQYSLDVSLTTPELDTNNNAIPNINFDMTLPNFKSYFIPYNLLDGDVNVPTLYDTITLDTGKELQIVMNPLLIVELGTSADLVVNDPKLNSINNYVVTNEGHAKLGYVFNGPNYNNNTIFGLAILGL